MANLSDHEDAASKRPAATPAPPAAKPFNSAFDPSDPLGFLEQTLAFLAADSNLSERESLEKYGNEVLRMMKDRAETEDERKRKRAKIEGGDNAEEALPSPPPPTVEKEHTKEVEETESKVEEENKGLRDPNKGNGLDMANYSWGQTLEDIKITIPIPPKTMTRDIICEIRTDRIKFGLKGQPLVLDGELCKPISVNECFWVSDDKNPVYICLVKQDTTQKDWWKYLVKGEPEIDTQKVKPVKNKLSSPALQAAIEKMRQERIEKYKAKYTSTIMNLERAREH